MRALRWLARWWAPGWLWEQLLWGYLFAVVAITPACGGARDVACSDVSLRAVEVAHTEAALAVVASGKCDAYELVADCPAYQEVELYFAPGYAGWQLCR